MTEDERMRVLSLLDDVETSITAALKRLWARDTEALEGAGVYLEDWRDDVKSALKILTAGPM